MKSAHVYLGCTAKAITHRIAKIKNMNKTNGLSTPSTLNRKSKATAPTARDSGKKGRLFERSDDDDEEEVNHKSTIAGSHTKRSIKRKSYAVDESDEEEFYDADETPRKKIKKEMSDLDEKGVWAIFAPWIRTTEVGFLGLLREKWIFTSESTTKSDISLELGRRIVDSNFFLLWSKTTSGDGWLTQHQLYYDLRSFKINGTDLVL
jgi:hypothetical protein